MSLPSERIKPIDLGQALASAYALRNARQQGQMNDWQFSRAQDEYGRQQRFRDALTSGNMDAARAADPMAFMGLIKNQTEAKRAGLEIQKDESKLLDDKVARTQNAQRLILSALEENNSPERLKLARSKRDELVASGKYDHFDLPGEESAPDGGWVQSQPSQGEVVTAQAGAGIDTAGKRRAINEQTTSLRDKFDALPETKAWKIVKQGVDNIMSAAADGPGDLARIYSLVKILDTNSAVKDAEIGLAAGSGGYIQAMKSIIERAKGTGVLTPEMRQQLEGTAQRLAEAYRANFDQQAGNYAKLSKSYGLDPENVVMPLAPLATRPQQASAVPPNTQGPRTVPYTVPPPIAPHEADALADKYGFR